MLWKLHVKRRSRMSLSLAAGAQTLESLILFSWPGFWKEKIWPCLGRKRFWNAFLIGSRSPRTENFSLVCFCHLWISSQFLLKIYFALVVCLFPVSMVTTWTEKSKQLCKLGAEREAKVKRVLDQRGVVCNIGHQIWVPVLKLQGKCLLHPVAVCVGTKVRFMRWTLAATSCVGSLVTRQLTRGKVVCEGNLGLGRECDFCISPTVEIYVNDFECERLVSFHNGVGRVMLDKFYGGTCCSPNGVLYVLTEECLQKLEGSRFQTVLSLESIPEDLLFVASEIFGTKEEVIYVLDNENSRILRLNPFESFRPVVVG